MARKDVEQALAIGAPVRAKKPRNRVRRNRRTPQQLERQEKVFMLHLQGITTRALARQFKCSQPTILLDIHSEEARRAEELGARREVETARAIATYEDILRRALRKSDMYDSIVSSAMEKADRVAEGAEEDELADKRGKGDYQQAVRVTDHSLDAALKARERMDKIRGIDAPTKVDVKMQEFIDALIPQDGEDAQRV